MSMATTKVKSGRAAAGGRRGSVKVLGFMRSLADKFSACGRFGTAANYIRATNSLSAYLGGKDIPFSKFNEELVMSYDGWLHSRNVTRNTVSFYMRILRAVHHRAVRMNAARPAELFREVYTGVDSTRKRAVDETVLLRLQNLDLDGSRTLALARDIFVFSYFTRGMSFIDIAYLRKSDVGQNVICYCRHKTGQCLNIFIEPCMRRIMGRYVTEVSDSPYVFPLIKSTDPPTAFRQYHTALRYYNRKLKELSEMVGTRVPLSSYVARHTWATSARDHNIPISVISAGMGHSSEKTTRIYLASLENSVIDMANKAILKKFDADISL